MSAGRRPDIGGWVAARRQPSGPGVLGNTPGARLRGLRRPAVTASPIGTPALRTLMDPTGHSFYDGQRVICAPWWVGKCAPFRITGRLEARSCSYGGGESLWPGRFRE